MQRGSQGGAAPPRRPLRCVWDYGINQRHSWTTWILHRLVCPDCLVLLGLLVLEIVLLIGWGIPLSVLRGVLMVDRERLGICVWLLLSLLVHRTPGRCCSCCIWWWLLVWWLWMILWFLHGMDSDQPRFWGDQLGRFWICWIRRWTRLVDFRSRPTICWVLSRTYGLRSDPIPIWICHTLDLRISICVVVFLGLFVVCDRWSRLCLRICYIMLWVWNIVFLSVVLVCIVCTCSRNLAIRFCFWNRLLFVLVRIVVFLLICSIRWLMWLSLVFPSVLFVCLDEFCWNRMWVMRASVIILLLCDHLLILWCISFLDVLCSSDHLVSILFRTICVLLVLLTLRWKDWIRLIRLC